MICWNVQRTLQRTKHPFGFLSALSRLAAIMVCFFHAQDMTPLMLHAELSVLDFKRSNSFTHIGNGTTVTLDQGAVSCNAPAYTLQDSGAVVLHSCNPKNRELVQQDTILRLWQRYLIGSSHKYTQTVVVARGNSTRRMCDAEVYSDLWWMC